MTANDLRNLYRQLYRIRRTEEVIAELYPRQQMRCPVHLCIGQEAIAVGVCAALRPTDHVFSTHRSHGHYLAKGGSLPALMAELHGKETGCSGGKGGSMHLIDTAAGIMGTSAVVGTTIPNAVGHAYACRLRREETVVATFFGDGATEEGCFTESLNFAALKRLPVLFVCENNGYAIHTPQSRRQATTNICARVRAHGIPAERLDGNDVTGLVERAAEVVEDVRAGAGPQFLEVMTYRWREHVGPGEDYHLGFRPAAEATPWIAGDPLCRLAGSLDPAIRAEIEAEIEAEIRAAFEFAEESPEPEPAELFSDVC